MKILESIIVIMFLFFSGYGIAAVIKNLRSVEREYTLICATVSGNKSQERYVGNAIVFKNREPAVCLIFFNDLDK